MRLFLFLPALLLAACAPTVSLDDNEKGAIDPGLTVDFDPGGGVVPFPNNLILDPITQDVSIPEQCNESQTAQFLREFVLNSLDGFGLTDPPIRTTFPKPVDVSTLSGRAFLVRIAANFTPGTVNPLTEPPVPLVPVATQTIQYEEGVPSCTNPQARDTVVFRPGYIDAACAATSPPSLEFCFVPHPLEASAVYALYLLDGITAADGTPFVTNSTWGLTRTEDPLLVVTEEGLVVENNTPLDPYDTEERKLLESLQFLWEVHAGPLSFFDAAAPNLVGRAVARDEILLAWAFKTMTADKVFDTTVTGSVGETIGTTTTTDMSSVNDETNAATITATFEGALCPPGTAPCGVCASVPCSSVGAIVTGQITSPRYQDIGQTPSTGSAMIPTNWGDPVDPAKDADENLDFISFVPAGTVPTNGWPTVIFGHGLTRVKEDLFAIAATMAQAGVASIAIDAVAHGSRAVRIDTSSAGCVGNVAPQDNPFCYAPFFNTFLNVTRDNIRQTVVDTMQLAEVLSNCNGGGSTCGASLEVDPARIGYLGQSLGAIMGPMSVAMSPHIATAVLNVGASGWMDVVSFTTSLGLKCPLIDSLIAAGALSGTLCLFNGASCTNANALCEDPGLLADPGYQVFAATTRWVLDPADSTNFLDNLVATGKAVLVQEVDGDMVVPNTATFRTTSILGLSPTVVAEATSTTPTATAEAAGTTSTYLRYTDYPAGTGTNNNYEHGSLLQPADGTTAGAYATAQMQTDALTFLLTNLP